jgi:PTH1 family peptidyl-tRNA hydrolase
MKSAIAHLGTQNFPRLRIGIGRPQSATSSNDPGAVSHVLGRFSSAESQLMSEVLQLVVEAVELSFKQGVEKAMNRYNNRNLLATKGDRANESR